MDIKINIDLLTIGDLEKFEEWGSGNAKISAVIPLLERIVECEKPIREMPYTSLRQILEALGEELKGAADPKN